MRRGLASAPATPKAAAEQPEAEEEADTVEDRQRQVAEVIAQLGSEAVGEKDAVDKLYAMPEDQALNQNEGYSQAIFDDLNSPRKSSADEYGAGGLAGESMIGTFESKERLNTLGKVADLKLDAAYQKKSEVAEQSQQEERFRDDERLLAPGRMKRREQISLPESEPVAMAISARRPVSNLAGPTDLRISTFESEIDPLEFSLLDSGHFVLFRKVWREGERYIQGLLIDKAAFIHGAFDNRFDETGLSAMSNLIVAYQDDVIHTLTGKRYSDYPNSSQAFDGAVNKSRLVQHQPAGLRRGLASSPTTPKAASDQPEAEEEADTVSVPPVGVEQGGCRSGSPEFCAPVAAVVRTRLRRCRTLPDRQYSLVNAAWRNPLRCRPGSSRSRRASPV